MSQSVNETIASLIQPAIELDSQLSLKEAELLEQLDTVRTERRRLAAILRAADPDRPAPAKSGPKPGSSRTDGLRLSSYAIAENVVEDIRQIIAANFEDEEFTSRDIFDRWEGEGSDTAIRDKIVKALARLRERGQIRLVSTARGKHGGHRYLATPNIQHSSVETVAGSNGSGS